MYHQYAAHQDIYNIATHSQLARYAMISYRENGHIEFTLSIVYV